jgi:hypothetical protein
MKPFYAISLFLLTVLIGCQYLTQHPDEVKKIETSVEEIIDVGLEAHKGPSGATGV